MVTNNAEGEQWLIGPECLETVCLWDFTHMRMTVHIYVYIYIYGCTQLYNTWWYKKLSAVSEEIGKPQLESSV